MPAFLGTAVGILTDSLDRLADDRVRRALAIATGVEVSPSDPNPWGLPIAREAADLGVTTRSVVGDLQEVTVAVGGRGHFALEVMPLNTIPFQLYEDAVVDLAHDGAVVGLSFDHYELAERAGHDVVATDAWAHARHIARLTPSGDREVSLLTIRSPEFRTDYTGPINVFDDSGEMGTAGMVVDWLHLVGAARAIDGGYWIVREVS